MKEQDYDWAAIVKSPAFIKLQRKKSLFLLSLWIFGATPYFLLTIGAGYMPELFSIKIFGRMNIGYLFCISQFFMTIAIGIYYTYRTSKDFDPMTRNLLDELHRGEA